MKTYLILISNAPQMGVYHKALGDKLKHEGYNVIYAFSDYLPIFTYELNLSEEKYYVFSDYFKQHKGNIILNEEFNDLNLWKTFFCDYDRTIVHHHRKIFKKDYYENLLKNLINFFDEIFKKDQIDLFIYENISNSFVYTCFEVAKRKGIEFRGYVGSRLTNRFEMHTEEFGIRNQFKHKFENINLDSIDQHIINEIDLYLQKYSGDIIPSYHSKKSLLSANYSLLKRYFKKDKIEYLKGAIKFSIFEKGKFKYAYQIMNPFSGYFNLFKHQIIKKVRTKFANKYFSKIDYEDDFFLFPLHMKPESSTSVLARHFCDDIAVIRNIAFNLPFGTKLYVKEHFVNYGNLSLSFYKEIQRIPNVKLIHCDENTMQLVKRCRALITLTSTMGLEALLMNKKIVVLGNVFYECHPNCIKLKDFENLFSVLNSIEEPIVDQELSRRFIAAYRCVTYEGNVAYPLYEKQDLNRFTSAMLSALKEYENKQED